jgi:putative nucleotidyltransferase with HDIG domain
MIFSRKRGARRREIRKKCPDAGTRWLLDMRADGSLRTLWVAVAFCIATVAVMSLRLNVIAYRPGQYATHDIVSRVPFRYHDKDELEKKKRIAREIEPRVYTATDTDSWKKLEETLLGLPQQLASTREEELPAALKPILDSATLNKLQEYAEPARLAGYQDSVRAYVAEIRRLDPIILPGDQLAKDRGRPVQIPGRASISSEMAYSLEDPAALSAKLQPLAQANFLKSLAPKIVQLTLASLKPTHAFNDQATVAAQNAAAERVPTSDGDLVFDANDKIVPVGEISIRDWQLLRAENAEYLRRLDSGAWRTRAGLLASVAIITLILSCYVAKYQRRIIRNYARAVAIAALMLSMLLLAQLAGIGSSSLYVFGIAPTIIVAMILTIAYDQRFAVGVATVHAILVTLALNEKLSFFLILLAGVLTCCFLLDDIRTRSKLIEVGGATALAMIVATAAAGLLELDPWTFIARNCLYAGAAGLGVGFVILGTLPFIERAFRITTSMTLLELADASQPLLRRLALEAPGTYNHSLQVATLSEEAAEAIGANSLLCRVGAYYHDVGKINKAEYFVENQVAGHNRHINLSPSVSLLIIIGHVKDGIELAREYNLPTNLFPFIQQHHGTTLVEFFYHQACNQQQTKPGSAAISDTQYRYPGPKPKSKEIAILMLADAVESATRAMSEPTASRIETLVHELAHRRLQDGQFDECDITMRDLERIERSLAKTLLGIYHGRLAYPSTAGISSPTASTLSAKTA